VADLKKWAKVKAWTERLRREIRVLYLAYRHPGTPAYAKAWVACVVAYAISPIDLIPDFIPVLGYLDDLVLLPLGIWLAVRMIPADVLAECRARAGESIEFSGPLKWAAAAVIAAIWAAAVVLIVAFLRRLFCAA